MITVCYPSTMHLKNYDPSRNSLHIEQGRKNKAHYSPLKNKFHFAWKSYFHVCLLSCFNRVDEICLSVPKFVKNKLWVFCHPIQNFFAKKSNRRGQNSSPFLVACLFVFRVRWSTFVINPCDQVSHATFQSAGLFRYLKRMSLGKGWSSASDRAVTALNVLGNKT